MSRQIFQLEFYIINYSVIHNYMKKSLTQIFLLLSILIFGKPMIAQQNLTIDKKLSEATLLDSLDDCSKYTLKVSTYKCFTRSDFDIEVCKDEQGYYMLFGTTHKFSLSAEGSEMKYSRLSTTQFNKIREFEMHLGKGHEHKQYCRSTTFINVGLNTSKKHFRYCGCGSSAYLEIKNILLTNQD